MYQILHHALIVEVKEDQSWISIFPMKNEHFKLSISNKKQNQDNKNNKKECQLNVLYVLKIIHHHFTQDVANNLYISK